MRVHEGWHRVCYGTSKVNHHKLECQTITGCSQPWWKALSGQYLSQGRLCPWSQKFRRKVTFSAAPTSLLFPSHYIIWVFLLVRVCVCVCICVCAYVYVFVCVGCYTPPCFFGVIITLWWCCWMRERLRDSRPRTIMATRY